MRSLVPGFASLTPISFPEAPFLLLKQTLTGTWSVFDPETGLAVGLTAQPSKGAFVVAASRSGMLTFDPNSDTSSLSQTTVR